MRFEVTQKDIKAGTPRNGMTCPVGLAMSRQTGIPWRIGPYVAEHRDGRGRLLFDTHLPEQVTMFIRRFDKGEDVDPFEFELYIPASELPA